MGDLQTRSCLLSPPVSFLGTKINYGFNNRAKAIENQFKRRRGDVICGVRRFPSAGFGVVGCKFYPITSIGSEGVVSVQRDWLSTNGWV